MTPAQGRVIFFDALAAALQQSYCGNLPNHIAIVFSGQELPHDDRVSLAHALCRLRDPMLGVIPIMNADSTDLSPRRERAIVVDLFGAPTDCDLQRFVSTSSPASIMVFIMSIKSHCASDVVRLPCDLDRQYMLLQRAIEALFRAVNRTAEPLAGVRFRRKGFSALVELDIFDGPVSRDWSDPLELEANASLLGESWRYCGEPVSGEAIASWILQFKPAGFMEEAICLLRHLQRDGYVTQNRVVGGIMNAYDRFRAGLAEEPLAIALQPIGKSEHKLAYDLIGIRFFPVEEVLQRVEDSRQLVQLVCIDDFVGSGRTMTDALFKRPFSNRLASLFERKKAHLTALVSHADAEGIRAICSHSQAHGAVAVQAEQVVDGALRVFDDNSVVITDRARREAFKDFCAEVGRRIYRHPLGWNNCQWCIVADYTVPNASLPILFASSRGTFNWQPLFQRNRTRAR